MAELGCVISDLVDQVSNRPFPNFETIDLGFPSFVCTCQRLTALTKAREVFFFHCTEWVLHSKFTFSFSILLPQSGTLATFA
jgi:hypothetical protein